MAHSKYVEHNPVPFRTAAIAVLLSGLSIVAPSNAHPDSTPGTRAILEPKIDDRSLFRCEAVISIEPHSVSVGEIFKITCEAHGRGESGNLFNAFLSERHRLPAQIVVTSADGKRRYEILRPAEGAPDKSDAGCWLSLGSRNVGRELVMKVGDPTADQSPPSTMRLIDLPPGEYYVQAIYNYWLVAHWVNAPNSGERRPTDGTADEPRPILGFSKAQMDEPMAISEAIKLVVNAKAATPAKAVPLPDSPLRLDLGPPVWRAAPNDQWADVKFRLTNPTSETITVFNPGIDSRLFFNKQALNLIVINADEKQVGNYTDHNWGTSRTPRRNNWVRFSPGATISSQLEFQPRTIPLTEYDLGRNKLPPGKYFLELRGRRSLLTPPPAILNETDDFAIVREHSTYQTWWRGFPGPEICRSNRVELEILPRTGD